MRVISVLSSKGGVGKTTLVTNLSAALSKLGYDVVAIDANFTTPHLATHLGYQLVPHTLHSALRGQISIKHAVYFHPSGFKFIPGSIGIEDLIDVDMDKLSSAIGELEADFVFIDCAPGMGREALSGLRSCDEVLIVTNPELPSILDAAKTIGLVEALDKKVLGVVLNRVQGKKFELERGKIASILGRDLIAEIPEDTNVQISVSCKFPVVDLFPDSRASINITKLAYKIAGLPFFEKKSLVERLVGWMFK